MFGNDLTYEDLRKKIDARDQFSSASDPLAELEIKRATATAQNAIRGLAETAIKSAQTSPTGIATVRPNLATAFGAVHAAEKAGASVDNIKRTITAQETRTRQRTAPTLHREPTPSWGVAA